MRTDFLAQLPESSRVPPVSELAPSSERKHESSRTYRPDELTTPVARTQESNLAQDLFALHQELRAHEIELQFSRDQETGQTVMKLVDQKTGDTLQQIPREVSLKLAAAFGKLQGNLINREA